MVKRKVKKVVKQKQKQRQNVKVNQNVKVVVGDVKRKQVRKASGAKAGASAKPPIVLNISNPQPLNTSYLEYFKQQLQNQEPIKANTLKQNEILNEREESKASKAGTLHKLDQEPNDLARELKKQSEQIKSLVAISLLDRKAQQKEVGNSVKKLEVGDNVKKLKRPKIPKRPVRLVLEETSENSMLSELEQQRNMTEQAISKGEEEEESGLEAEGEKSDVPPTPVMTYKQPQNPIAEKPKTGRRGRKPLSQDVINARLEEEKRLRQERLQMIAEDKPGRRGRKMLTEEELDRRRMQRELMKLQSYFDPQDTEGDY